MALTRLQIGTRLKQVREEIGFTQAVVARQLGVHRPTISEIEAGRRAVTSEELFEFARLYAKPLAELLAEPTPTEANVLQVMFRAEGADSPEARLAVQQFMQRCRDERELELLLELPRPVEARPSYRAAVPATKTEAIRQGEQIAEQERRRLDLGSQPVRGVVELMERQGVSIGPILPADGVKVDGFYFETDGLGACIAINPNNDDTSGFREVFTAAHEYAHWLLRDRQVELLNLNSAPNDLIEVRANAFAAAFLLPSGGLKDYFASAGMLGGDLKLSHLSQGDVVRAMDYFGVSRQALLFRLQNVGMIPEETRLALWNFSVRAAANALGIEFGRREYIGTRLPMLAIHAWRQGLISTARAAELCGIDISDYQALVRDIGEEQVTSDDAPLLGAAAG